VDEGEMAEGGEEMLLNTKVDVTGGRESEKQEQEIEIER